MSNLANKLCQRCSEIMAMEERICKKCGTLQRVARAEYVTEDEREERLRRILAGRHVPDGLRKAIDRVNFAYDDPRLHFGVKVLGGLAAAGIVYATVDLLNYASGGPFPLEELWVKVLLLPPCAAAFWYGAKYTFRAFYIILEVLSLVFEQEADAYVRRGLVKEKARQAQQKPQAGGPTPQKVVRAEDVDAFERQLEG